MSSQPTHLRIHQYAGLLPGPRFLVTAAVHGNEIHGTQAMAEIIRQLDAGELVLQRGTLLMFGGTSPIPGGRFRQDNDFYYLTGNESFNGALVMQLHGDGPVRMLVVECLSDLSMRATAKLAEGAEIADDATLADLVHAHGHGRFAITLDPKDKLPGQQPYQGIVPLADEHV